MTTFTRLLFASLAMLGARVANAQPPNDESAGKPMLERIGVSVTGGGGVEGFTGTTMRDTTTVGGSWFVRATLGTKSVAGFEASYLGSAQAIDALARDVHAAKGESSLLGLARLTEALHGLEEPLTALRSGAECDDVLTAELRSRAQIVRQVATEACRILDQFAHPAHSTPEAPPRRPTASRLQPLLEATERFTSELGSQLGKPARFVSRIDDDALSSEHDELLREVLPQLVRNALVHGVEDAAARESLGKPATATVQFVARSRGTRAEWVFQDDGAGLDLERLRARAAEAGVAVALGADPATLAFLPGVSTAQTIDRHAGRGIGLDLVRERVESHGGRVRIHSAPARFCAVQIVLPLVIGVSA